MFKVLQCGSKLEKKLSECQTALIRVRCRVTRCLIRTQAVCIVSGRLRVIIIPMSLAFGTLHSLVPWHPVHNAKTALGEIWCLWYNSNSLLVELELCHRRTDRCPGTDNPGLKPLLSGHLLRFGVFILRRVLRTALIQLPLLAIRCFFWHFTAS